MGFLGGLFKKSKKRDEEFDPAPYLEQYGVDPEDGPLETLPDDYVGTYQYYMDEERRNREEWEDAYELGIDLDDDD